MTTMKTAKTPSEVGWTLLLFMFLSALMVYYSLRELYGIDWARLITLCYVWVTLLMTEVIVYLYWLRYSQSLTDCSTQ